MKKILLTGATDGIGLETAKALVTAGHTVLLHGRNAAKLARVEQELIALNPQAQVQSFTADFSRLEDVRSLADAVLNTGMQLDAIINNAGVFVVQGASSTVEGLDVRLMVNVVAPYVLTKALLPIMHARSRVINVGSAAQASVDFTLFSQSKVLADDMAYAQSKLALTMWTMAMAEKYPQGPQFITVNPKSFLGSKMVREAYGQQGHDLRIGAEILCKAALSEDFAKANGMYFDNDYGRFASPHPFALKAENRAALMQLLDAF